MNQTVSRILWAIAGILLIAAGILCLADPGLALVTMSLYLGIAMLVSGIIDIIIFARGNGRMIGAGWFLAAGILTVLRALFLLFHQAFTLLSLPFIAGMWLLFSGTGKFVNSFELRRFGVRGWGWFTAWGVVLMLAGFLSFVDPIANLFVLSALVGVMLVLQGIVSIGRACFSHRLWQ